MKTNGYSTDRMPPGNRYRESFMEIYLAGVRGSISSPMQTQEYRSKLKKILALALQSGIKEEQIHNFILSLPPELKNIVGGNTTCVGVSGTETDHIIIDCGSGIRHLGDKLMKGPLGQGKGTAHIFITHTHWDHIQGFPFFKPAYIPGNKLHFYSIFPDLKERMQQQQDSRFFPVHFDHMPSEKFYHTLAFNQEYKLLGYHIRCHPLKHPGGSTAYRFAEGNHSFIFATDAEFTGEDLSYTEGNDFFFNADLLIIDAQYTLDESFQKFDGGIQVLQWLSTVP